MVEEYLTQNEVAERLKIGKKAVANKMSDGTWRRGVHWFRPKGMRTRFKWSTLVEWMEEGPKQDEGPQDLEDRIPMARGYYLGGGFGKRQR